MKISLVILTYNEIVGLRALIDKIPFGAVDEYFTVDNNSTDGTAELLKSKGIPVHFQAKSGRGEAFKLAFEKATGDAVIFFSPDGNEDPGDIPKFRPLLEAGSDMVIATRMAKGAHNEEDGQFFRWRKWVNLAFTFMANLIWNRGKYVTDTINGLRCITRRAWGVMKPDSGGYTIEYQSSIRAFKNKLNIVEFPTYESARLDGREGAPAIKTGLDFVRLFLKELFTRCAV